MNDKQREFFIKEWSSNPAVNLEIHNSPCKYCPSTKGSDPESDDLKNHVDKDLRYLLAFPCAWRPEKRCKGLCDFLEIE